MFNQTIPDRNKIPDAVFDRELCFVLRYQNRHCAGTPEALKEAAKLLKKHKISYIKESGDYINDENPNHHTYAWVFDAREVYDNLDVVRQAFQMAGVRVDYRIGITADDVAKLKDYFCNATIHSYGHNMFGDATFPIFDDVCKFAGVEVAEAA